MAGIVEQVGSGYAHGNRQTTAYNHTNTSNNQTVNGNMTPNWGEQAGRSIYSVMANHSDTGMGKRSLTNSRLWHGVPQLTVEQMNMFEAAYTGHTFIFVIDMPKFMYSGIYENTNLHYQAKNLKAIIERASTSFNGSSNITAQTADMDDGNGRKITHITGVTKEQPTVTLTLHEFAGLPVKNALESWMTGTYDYRSEHGHYFGNLGIPGGWCLANHTMSMLVVQVDPSWQVIQDAAFYYNMFPTEVPFEHFEWEKGEHSIIDKHSIQFTANEERSPMIMYAAERFMNNRILSMVATSVYNSRQFVVSNFYVDGVPQDYAQFKNNLNPTDAYIIDSQQYNTKISNTFNNGDNGFSVYSSEGKSAIEEYETDNSDKKAYIKSDRYESPNYLKNDSNATTEYHNPNGINLD